MNLRNVVDLLNASPELLELTGGRKAQGFVAEEVKTIQRGANVVVIPGTWGEDDMWGSDKPNARRYEIQVNVESTDFDLSSQIARKVNDILMLGRWFQYGAPMPGDLDNIRVIGTRYYHIEFE